MEGVINIPFIEPHRAIRGFRLPNILQEPGKACPKLHGFRFSRFVDGRVDGGGNIIRCRQGITYQSGLPVRLVHGLKARDTDVVAKHQQCHVHRYNNSEATLCPFQQLLLVESGSFLCQGGCMWASGNGGNNIVQIPGQAYISRAA